MITYFCGKRNRKTNALSQRHEYLKLDKKTKILKPSNFISGTITSEWASAIHSQLPGNPFAIQTCEASDQDHITAVFMFHNGILSCESSMYLKGLLGFTSYKSSTKLPW